MADAKVIINVHDGILEFEGEEIFVEQQIARFEDLINKSFSSLQRPSSKSSIENTETTRLSEEQAGNKSEGLDDLADVFEMHDGKLHIIKDIPGPHVKAQTLSAALLVCLGNIKSGADNALVEDIRSECERHGCYNPKKFATYLRSYNNLFLESGSGKSSTIKLTVPGRNLAEDLVSRLKNNDIGDFFANAKSKPAPKSSSKKSSSKSTEAKKSSSSSSRPGPGAIIDSLIAEGFFDKEKGPADVVAYCKESKVLTYSNTEISVSLARAVKSNKLKREKSEDGQYGYSKP
ncbi:MAG: hypothetical protein JXR16_17060 [Bermanella sp.]